MGMGLDMMGLDVPSPRQSQQPAPTPPRSDMAMHRTLYPNPDDHRPLPLPSHPIFQPALSHNFGPESMAMHPGVFETMSTLEPLSVRVGAIHESENQSSFG